MSIDQLAITAPCSALWEEMVGDDRARFCKLCSKVVHDTTGLTTCELERMLAAPTAPCLRVHRDLRGRVLTRDRLAALAFVGLAACTGAGDTGLDSADSAGPSGPVVHATSLPSVETHETTLIPEMSSASPVRTKQGQARTDPPAATLTLPPPEMGEPMPELPIMTGGVAPMPTIGKR